MFLLLRSTSLAKSKVCVASHLVVVVVVVVVAVIVGDQLTINNGPKKMCWFVFCFCDGNRPDWIRLADSRLNPFSECMVCHYDL